MDIKEELELLEDIALKEELHNMTIEEIMQDGHFSRELAQAIYNVEHNIGISKAMTLEEFRKELYKDAEC